MKLNPILKTKLIDQRWSKDAMDLYSYTQWQSVLYARKVRIYSEFGVDFLQLYLAKAIVNDRYVSTSVKKFNQGLIDEATCNIQFASLLIAASAYMDF